MTPDPRAIAEFLAKLSPEDLAKIRAFKNGDMSDADVMTPAPRDYGKAKVITKREPFGRIVWARYDEAANRIIYRHATKGIRSRKYSDELFAQLLSQRS